MKENIRQITQNRRHKWSSMKVEKDIMLINKKIIDENGRIKTISQKVYDDSSEKLGSIPPYTADIEYIEMFGTLNNNPIHIGNLDNQKMSLREIQNITKDIVNNNKSIINNVKPINDNANEN